MRGFRHMQRGCAIGTSHDALDIVCKGTYSMLPCSISMNDLSNNAVSLMPCLYITSTRHIEIDEIRTTLNTLQYHFWDILSECGERKKIVASDNIARLALCSWASSQFNSKLIAAFYHTVQDELTIRISDEHITCTASKLDDYSAGKLLDMLACVALASGLLALDGHIGNARVEVTTTTINTFCVSTTIELPAYYMNEVKMNEAHLTYMYGHILAKLK